MAHETAGETVLIGKTSRVPVREADLLERLSQQGAAELYSLSRSEDNQDRLTEDTSLRIELADPNHCARQTTFENPHIRGAVVGQGSANQELEQINSHKLCCSLAEKTLLIWRRFRGRGFIATPLDQQQAQTWDGAEPRR